MKGITRRQFLMYLAGMVVVVKLPMEQSMSPYPMLQQQLTEFADALGKTAASMLPVIKSLESAEELAMRLWQHPNLSYWYSEDGKSWKQQVYHNITLPFSDGIVTLDSQLTTTKISAAFRVARRRVDYFNDMQVGIDWPKGRFCISD